MQLSMKGGMKDGPIYVRPCLRWLGWWIGYVIGCLGVSRLPDQYKNGRVVHDGDQVWSDLMASQRNQQIHLE